MTTFNCYLITHTWPLVSNFLGLPSELQNVSWSEDF